MAVHYVGDSDAATGDPTSPLDYNWDNSDVDLPGLFQRGQGFVPKPGLPVPANTPSRGMTLNRPYINPQTGQPEILGPNGGVTSGNRQIAGPTGGGFPNILSWLGGGNPYWKGAIAAGGILQPTPAETGEFTPAEPNFVRPDAPVSNRGLPAPPQRPGGIGSDANLPVMGVGGFPTTYGLPGQQPPPLAPDGQPAPIGSPAPAVPPRRPKNLGGGGGGAVARQRPNLGHYGPFVPITRPNMSANAGPRGPGGPPQMTALDLSSLFGGRR